MHDDGFEVEGSGVDIVIIVPGISEIDLELAVGVGSIPVTPAVGENLGSHDRFFITTDTCDNGELAPSTCQCRTSSSASCIGHRLDLDRGSVAEPAAQGRRRTFKGVAACGAFCRIIESDAPRSAVEDESNGGLPSDCEEDVKDQEEKRDLIDHGLKVIRSSSFSINIVYTLFKTSLCI